MQTSQTNTAPKLSLDASSAEDLIRKLSAIDIFVPLITEGRTKEHRECYIAARSLATVAFTPLLSYPLKITHLDKPDFILTFNGKQIGIECVEANHADNYHIEEIRERSYPESMVYGQKFVPGVKTFSKDEKNEIASGQFSGSAWMSGSMKRNWVEAMHWFIASKTTKLRQGNYLDTRSTWLLIHDEWPNPIHFYPEIVQQGAAELHSIIAPLLATPAFEEILLASDQQIFRFNPASFEVYTIPKLWDKA